MTGISLTMKMVRLFFRIPSKPLDLPELEITRDQIQGINLETGSKSQHLILTLPQGRREIGPMLGKEEKVWIHGLVRKWLDQ